MLETKEQTLYKLTDAAGQTRGGTQWGENITHTATGDESQPLCSNGWIHAYEHPDLAVLLNPMHADFQAPRLWEARGVIGGRNGQLKCGCRMLTTVREIPLPEWGITQRVAFGILCALEVCTDSNFKQWAENWLSGGDRTTESAAYAEWAAARAGRAAAEAAAYATRAAAGTYAAEAAAYAAEAARAAYAARAVAGTYAADAAAAAADAAAAAARAANSKIDLIAIAQKAKQVK